MTARHPPLPQNIENNPMQRRPVVGGPACGRSSAYVASSRRKPHVEFATRRLGEAQQCLGARQGLAAFQSGDRGLAGSHPVSQFGLRKTCAQASPGDHLRHLRLDGAHSSALGLLKPACRCHGESGLVIHDRGRSCRLSPDRDRFSGASKFRHVPVADNRRGSLASIHL